MKKVSTGEELYAWEDVDHVSPERGTLWYIGFSFFMLLLCGWGMAEKVYSMTLVFLVIAFFYLYNSNKAPEPQKVVISTLGVKIGEKKFIPYSSIKSFWFIYFDDVHLLHFSLKGKIGIELVVPVISGDSGVIRDLLQSRDVREIEGKGESFIEWLARKLKL